MGRQRTTRLAGPGHRAQWVGALALALGALGAVACGEESAGPEARGAGAGGCTAGEGGGLPQQREVTLDELNDTPKRFVGQLVTVSGEVQRVVVSPGAFALGSTGDQDPAVVVLPTKRATIPQGRVSKGDTVRVQGTVCPVSAQIGERDDFLFENEEGFNADEAFEEFRAGIAASKVDTTVPEKQQ